MALMNSTTEQQTAQAEKELKEKLALEASMVLVLNKIFRDISSAIVESYNENQQGPDLSLFDQRIREELNSHNEEVASVFGSQVIDFIAEESGSESRLDKAVDQIALETGTSRADVINGMSVQTAIGTGLLIANITNVNSAFINNTNQASISEAIKTAEQAVLSPPALSAPTKITPPAPGKIARLPPPKPSSANLLASETTKKIGSLAAGMFLSEALQRSKTISATTTQQVAEGVKEVEIDAVQTSVSSSAAVEGDAVADLIEPVWVTVGDALVRPAHVEANGQSRGEGGVPGKFLVGGEALRFPGDPFGSPENTINCRCSLIFVLP